MTPATAPIAAAPAVSQTTARWAATMHGTTMNGTTMNGTTMHGTIVDLEGLRTAHASTTVQVAPTTPLRRADRERRETEALVDGATRSVGSGNRVRDEAPDDFRTCFERDRDRILHGATAFRRLAGKTQVFIFPDDHQRTRLTHALEVAQVAVAIARACRLNEALTEAIALGHDCGHGPGGHASEEALSPYLPGGFDHAVWGADVVLAPLNLCVETLDGIRNHSWSRPAPATPEAEVVSWADRIAYVCHDFEDAVAAGIITPSMLPEVVARRCGRTRGAQLDTFISGLVETITTTGHVAMPDDLADALAAYRQFNYDTIYLRPASVRQAESVITLLRALVEHFADRPNLVRAAGEADLGTWVDGDGLLAAVTHVAGMTDRYACQTAVAHLGWSRDQLPRGIDLPR